MKPLPFAPSDVPLRQTRRRRDSVVGAFHLRRSAFRLFFHCPVFLIFSLAKFSII